MLSSGFSYLSNRTLIQLLVVLAAIFTIYWSVLVHGLGNYLLLALLLPDKLLYHIVLIVRTSENNY